MKRSIVGLFCAVLCSGSGAAAQGFVEGLEAAQAKIDATQWKEALEILLPLHGKVEGAEDIKALAASLKSVGDGMDGASDFGGELRARTAELAAYTRLHGEADHTDVARGLHYVAYCLDALGRAGEALPSYEASLAMWRRLHGERDHADVALGLLWLASCLRQLGRSGEALELYGELLAIQQRLNGDRDHADVASSLNAFALCLNSLGRAGEALPTYEAALAMRQRINDGRDHSDVAQSFHNVAHCLRSLGRESEALPLYEAALAMQRRLWGDREHRDLALSLSAVGVCLGALGRTGEELPFIEAALAMHQRLCGERDSADVALGMHNLAACLDSLGRAGDARPHYEAALAMWKRLNADTDHPHVAAGLNGLGTCMSAMDRHDDALLQFEAALAMWKRIHGDRDHPNVGTGMSNVASCLGKMHRAAEALPLHEAALAMRQRVHGDRDHPEIAAGMVKVALSLQGLGRSGEALLRLEGALEMLKRLYREHEHPEVASAQVLLAYCLRSLGRTTEALVLIDQALGTIERIRDATRLSTVFRQSLFEDMKRLGAFELFQHLANQVGSKADALHAAERSRGRDLLDQFAQCGDLLAEAQRRASLRGDEKAVDRLGDLHADIESGRAEGDRVLHELTRLADSVDATERAGRRQALMEKSDSVSKRLRQLLDERARLLGEAIPVGRVRTAADLRSSLQKDELLLEYTVAEAGAWLYVVESEGEVDAIELPRAFAATKQVLPEVLRNSAGAGLAQRGRDPSARDATGNATAVSRELFASLIPAPVWERVRCKKRIFVAAHRALHRLPFELLVTEMKGDVPSYWLDTGPAVSYVPSGSVLYWLRTRQPAPHQKTIDVLAVGDPMLGEPLTEPIRGADAARIAHHDDLERIHKLPQLRGARAEAEAIATAFRNKEAKAELLLSADATEPAVFALASKAKYLHFACHGIAEEYVGQSLSMLVLTQAKDVQPGGDGFLKLDDLVHAWSGHLDDCELVTLSACRTNVGDTGRDEAPQALPIGFLLAGAPAVISSLWAVDDASTKDLMTDFYGRLLAGETDKLAAFTAAKRELRAKYPDPFHWAPFLYMGAPE